MQTYSDVQAHLRQAPRRFAVTGVAGFIGSNVLEALLALGQDVVGLDNFATGHRHNLDDVLAQPASARGTFRLVEGDLRDPDACRAACEGADVVLHQAALGSVPRSLADPATTHAVNADGTLNVFLAARDAGARRVVYASSSSVYGDHPGMPKREPEVGRPLSPYAVTKRIAELYAPVVQAAYGVETVGLRYFNVFGRRQDPNGPYAAVMPKWIAALLAGEPCVVYGDGETSRDFCYVQNVVQANLLAALAPAEATGRVYNVAYGSTTSLNTLFGLLRDGLRGLGYPVGQEAPVVAPFRAGDIRHSLADTSAARDALGYAPTHAVRDGLAETLAWYAAQATAAV